MVDQYYRKTGPRFGGRFNRLTKNRTVLLTLLIVVPMLSFVTFSNKGVLRRLSLEAERREMWGEIKAAEQKNQQLEELVRKLDQDNKAIEKRARESFGLKRPGETVYKVRRAQ